METSIFKKDGEIWTRFKIPIMDLKIYAPIIRKYVDINNPTKKSSRYIYYEHKGDLLNHKKQEVLDEQ